MRVFHETAQVSSFVITGFAFLFLAVLNWTPRLSVATFLEAEVPGQQKERAPAQFLLRTPLSLRDLMGGSRLTR